MDNRLIEKEREALDAITLYMKEELNQRIAYAKKKRSQITPISQQVQAFWDECIQVFKHDVNFLSEMETDAEEKFEDLNIEIDADVDFSVEIDTEIDFDVEIDTEEGFNSDIEGHSKWQNAMEELKKAYRYAKRAYCISTDQEPQLDKQFKRLCKGLAGKTKPVNYSVLGSTDFTHLPYMLNLQDERVCALLPYLLTAYTFNFQVSNFFRKRELVSLISCTENNVEEKFGDIDSSEAAKKRNDLKKLARVFSLENCKKDKNKKKLISVPKQAEQDEQADKKRPVPFCEWFEKWKPDRSYVMHQEVLDYVFDFWCAAILECAPLAEEGGVPLNIDFKSCKELYSSYTQSD